MSQTFVSHGQNREDVVLWRALKDVGVGRYVEVGGNDPDSDSISRAFYDRGWSGLIVEPEPTFAARYRERRPRDIVVEAAVSSRPGTVTLHRFAGTGLSTVVDEIGAGHLKAGFTGDDVTVEAVTLASIVADHGLAEQPVHFLMVDVEGAEADVLSTVDLTTFRPWILVIESTRPNSTETAHDEWEPMVLAADYEFCLFDGLSRFYVAAEKADELRDALSYPACALDDFISVVHRDLIERIAILDAQVLRWRRAALETWATAIAESHMAAVHEANAARAKVAALRGRVRNLRRRNEELQRQLDRARRQQFARRAARKVVRRLR